MGSIQDSLQNTVKLAFQESSYATCAFTDALEQFWGGIVTQTDEDQLEKTMSMQHHETMSFNGGTLTGAQRIWTTYKKKAYAMVPALNRMDYLPWGTQPVHVFTDHRNVLYFSPC